VVVAGAGMAGLVAAARLRELGVRARVDEKGTRPGGSMLLSSCVIWRHRDWDDFRGECPDGDPILQRLVWSRLDDALGWLSDQGAEPIAVDTGNPLTTGWRFEPAALTRALAARAAEIRLGTSAAPAAPRLILCTGGFGGSVELVARHIGPAAPLRLRANPWSQGDGLRAGLERGGATSRGLDQFYGRNMPDAAWDETQLVPLSQLYARFARTFDVNGVEFFARGDVSWSENNVVAATARRPGASAFYLLDEQGLTRAVRERTVAEIVAAAPAEARLAPDELPFAAPAGTVAAVRVRAAITHTIGGLRVDQRARVVDAALSPVDGLWAAGVDAGGVATGGYASGLAQALVLGLVAAEDAAGYGG
jgi:succinate dehydrogenase/fumarate reductase flavoprotein subunit